MRPIFNKIKLQKPGRNVFDLSHERKLSLNMGKLYPVYLQEVVPGDKFKVNQEIFMRFAPMVAPVMHRINVYVHYFFVPYRLLWDEWEDFITGGRLGTSTPNMPFLLITQSNYEQLVPGSLFDHLGVPVWPDNGITVQTGDTYQLNAMPFRAYHQIWNEYYRDQNLTAEEPVLKTSGAIQATEEGYITYLRYRCWEKDYFTSALPWAQRGGDVKLPNTITYLEDAELSIQPGGGTPVAGGLSVADNYMHDTSNNHLAVQNIDEIGITINDLRRATKLQQWLERNARGGSRYIEQIFSHFGVKSSDARLQRPEYLGGTKQPCVISEVLSTYATAEDAPQGNMSGHGISVGKNFAFNRFFEEHGYIMGILSVLPRTAYQQGLPKLFTKFDKFDYFWPEFANIGEQEVKNQELYWDIDSSHNHNNDGLFGYQSRYAEYKFNQSTVHGDFKESLDHWHLGRKFSDLPVLNDSFVGALPSNHIFAVENDNIDHLYCQMYLDVKAIRPMPVFGTPSL